MLDGMKHMLTDFLGAEMSNIRVLKTGSQEKNEKSIEGLRDFLAMAEKGDVGEVVIVARGPDGGTFSFSSGTEHMQVLLGGLEIVKTRMLAQYIAKELNR